jgi:hypothetical protein
MTYIKVLCLLIDLENNPLGNPFREKIDIDDWVADLKVKKKTGMNWGDVTVAHVGVKNLQVWKSPMPSHHEQN